MISMKKFFFPFVSINIIVYSNFKEQHRFLLDPEVQNGHFPFFLDRIPLICILKKQTLEQKLNIAWWGKNNFFT